MEKDAWSEFFDKQPGAKARCKGCGRMCRYNSVEDLRNHRENNCPAAKRAEQNKKAASAAPAKSTKRPTVDVSRSTRSPKRAKTSDSSTPASDIDNRPAKSAEVDELDVVDMLLKDAAAHAYGRRYSVSHGTLLGPKTIAAAKEDPDDVLADYASLSFLHHSVTLRAKH